MAQWWKKTLQDLRQFFAARPSEPSSNESNLRKSNPPTHLKENTKRSTKLDLIETKSQQSFPPKSSQSIPSANNESNFGLPPAKGVTLASLGIDFGTRFTKVVLQSEGRSRAITLGDTPLLPSRIAYIDGQFYPPDSPAREGAMCIEYLKMRLMAETELSFAGDDHINTEDIRPLAALFLSGVLRLAKEGSFKSGLNRNAEIKWNAQVGVPVKTYGSKDLAVFQEVAGVAWTWKEVAPAPISMSELHRSYKLAVEQLASPEDLPIGVAPELVAAISHIASRRDAPEGLYALVDIGGGTLDGTSFVLRRDPQVKIDILAADVKSLGTIPTCQVLRKPGETIDEIEMDLISRDLPTSDQKKLLKHSEKVASILRYVLAVAIQKRPGLGFITWGMKGLDKALGAAKYRPVDVLLTGGGSPSPWYQSSFKNLDLHQWAIYPLRPQIIPKPADWRDNNYPRFVVANGLSNRELLIRYKWTLPDDNKPADAPPDWKPPFEQPTSKDML